ncbi:MAG: hypothetical protein ABJB78_02140 [Betaproteobacteria bacterium]
MKPAPGRARRSATSSAEERVIGPFVWTFDDTLANTLGDIEDTLRRAIVQLGDVASIVVLIEVSLPALRRRVDAGETIQPAWSRFVERMAGRYGLPAPPRIRPHKGAGPLATLVVAYRS